MTSRTFEQSYRLRLPALKVRLPSFIRSLFLLLPLWWFLGLDQFIWPFVFVALVLLLIYSRIRTGRSLIVPIPARLALIFLGLQLLSSLFIVESVWYLAFIRNFGLWLGGLSMFLLMVNLTPFGSVEFHKLIGSVLVVAFLSCLVSVLAVLGILDPHFVPPISKILPPIVRDSEFARAILQKSWTALETTTIFGAKFDRPRAFLTYPNPFAGFLVLTLPLALYYYSRQKRRSNRWFWLAFVAFVGLTLVLTTSRAGIVSCIIGALVLRHKLPPRLRIVLYALTICALIVGTLLVLSQLPAAERQSSKLVDLLVTARGQSHLTRMTVYAATIESWRDRPLFGWGTQRTPTVAGLSSAFPPLGSHSTYIAMLYRHGIAGLAVYLALIVSILNRFRQRKMSVENKNFLVYAKWAVLGNLVHAILLEVDLDAILLNTMWFVWALVVIATQQGKRFSLPAQAHGETA